MPSGNCQGICCQPIGNCLKYLYLSRIAKLLTPLILLTSCVVAISQLPIVSPDWQILLTLALPVATIVIAILLSIHFNRSRYSFLLLFLAIAGLSQTQFRGLLPSTENLLFVGLFLNSFIFSFFKDRSLMSIHGSLRIGFLLIQAIAIWYYSQKTPDLFLDFMNSDLLWIPTSLSNYSQLPDGIVVFALILNLILMILSITRNSSVHATFFGCQLGLLAIASGYPHSAFVPFLITSCSLMVILAIIMDSHDMAYRDELTQLPSRRALNQNLLSLGRRYTIAMLDIDHFKKFNDKHGHDIGDEVLKMVASKIARVSGGGKPYRYGGEEFTIVYSRKSKQQVEAHLESLREVIQIYKMLIRQNNRKIDKTANKQARVYRGKNDPKHKSLSVTISIGFAERTTDCKTPEEVIKGADQALYRAKRQGRNRISV
jgi:diguanylate cyclase (GGDEF)-like protein